MRGVQRPPGQPPTVPSILEASRVGTIFQREIYDEPATEAEGGLLVEQTLMVPGVADRVERGWDMPMRVSLV